MGLVVDNDDSICGDKTRKTFPEILGYKFANFAKANTIGALVPVSNKLRPTDGMVNSSQLQSPRGLSLCRE